MRLICWTLLTISMVVAAAKARAEEPASAAQLAFYEKNVRPILAKHCYACHSAEAKEIKGRLRLDTKAGWTRGGDSGPAIVPGKPEKSLLMRAVRYQDLEMPPEGKLSAAEIAVLEKWVSHGAAAPTGSAGPNTASTGSTDPTKTAVGIDWRQARQFWAFQPPRRSPIPAVRAAWAACDIDRFILARLEAADLRPAPDADPRTWLRRVTFDLTGLPPTPEEIERFVNECGTGQERSDVHSAFRIPDSARERVVDRLLASPRFGEQWGKHWLDVIRYADSNGSDFNATFHNAWRFRDYVIAAFQNDKPYDQFIREQLAGDLLRYESPEQQAEQTLATGFLMLGAKMLSERDKEKLRMDVVDEQIDATGQAFLGLTLGCARCHDHKFDPIPTTDYYALAGIFRSTLTLQGEFQEFVSRWVEQELPTSPEHAAALVRYKEQRTKLQSALAAARKERDAAQGSTSSPGAKAKAAAGSIVAARDLPGVVVDDIDAKKVGAWKNSTFSPHYVGQGYVHDDNLAKGEKSITFTPKLPRAGMYEVRISYAAAKSRSKSVPVTVRHADGVTEIALDETATPPVATLFKPLGRFRFEAGDHGSVAISTKGTEDGHVIADAVQFVTAEELAAHDKRMKEQVAKSAAKSPATLQPKAEAAKPKASAAEIERLAARVKQLDAELKQLDAAAPPPAPGMMVPREQDQIGDCRICVRGESHRLGPSVPRGFLQVLGSSRDGRDTLGQPRQSGRRELAEWIANPRNPLTARVMVNRIWQQLLGEGLVRSVDNFGHLGERPTHPELLDRLATDFMTEGWSVKQLVRRIVLSRVYGLSTQNDEDAVAIDAENQLLWRAHRRRLPAESLRDALLAAAGQLDSRAGGSPVIGLGQMAILTEGKRSGDLRIDENVRRSVYLPIVRGDLPEFLRVFDFPDRDLVAGRRAVTNVPAQALLLLNDAFVRRAAERAAQQIALGESDDAKRVEQAYELLLCREPTTAELQRALQFVREIPGGGKDASTTSLASLIQALVASTEFRWIE